MTGLAAYAHCATVPGLPTGLVSAAGENVITDGQFKLEDGGSIRIN